MELSPGASKMNTTQVKFRRPQPEKEKFLGLKEKKLCGLQNLPTDGRPTEFFFSQKSFFHR
jgi:hypothetical protein